MAKTKPSNKKNKGRNTRPKPKAKALTSGLDAAAKAYAQLLSDPCYAPIVHPVSEVSNSGFLVRVKGFVTAGGNAGAVDSITQFTPGNWATESVFAGSMWAFGYSTTFNGSLGVASGSPGPAFLQGSGVVGAYRPVAGCLKVHYLGSELNRQGRVSIGLLPSQAASTGSGLFTAPSYVTQCQKTSRLGDEVHEIKFVPLSSTDHMFTTIAGSANPTTNVTSMVVVVQNAPAGSVQIGYDFVYEWVPEPSSGLSTSLEATKSSNSASDVINVLQRAYGSLEKFATSDSGRAIASGLGRMVSSGLGYAARMTITG